MAAGHSPPPPEEGGRNVHPGTSQASPATPGPLPAPFRPGTLWPCLLARTERALETGALQTIPTEWELVEEGGIGFVVRVFTNFPRKEAERERRQEEARSAGASPNPFLPYEEDLFVADATDTHVCLLNKFNVVDRHLLIVPRAYEDQELLLTRQDFEALLRCMAEYESLGFYNGGKVAGASQPHKHLQLVPLPMAERGPVVPIEPALAGARWKAGIGVSPLLPFVHVFARPGPDWFLSPEQGARGAEAVYRGLLGAVGLKGAPGPGDERQSAPYNLLVTRTWMMLVPRLSEFFGPVSVNALGFAGALLVRDHEGLSELKRVGPMAVLAAAGVPA